MGNMRTIAFQVPEELFQKIKDYLQRNNMTQKEFMLGLIKNEIKRDLAQGTAKALENTEEAAEDYDEQEEAEEENEEQDNGDFLEDSDGESDEVDKDESESEEQGMSMGM